MFMNFAIIPNSMHSFITGKRFNFIPFVLLMFHNHWMTNFYCNLTHYFPIFPFSHFTKANSSSIVSQQPAAVVASTTTAETATQLNESSAEG